MLNFEGVPVVYSTKMYLGCETFSKKAVTVQQHIGSCITHQGGTHSLSYQDKGITVFISNREQDMTTHQRGIYIDNRRAWAGTWSEKHYLYR